MAITLDGTSGITTPAVTNNGAYTGDGISFADGTPSNTLVTTTGGNVGIGTSSPAQKLDVVGSANFGSSSTTGAYAARFYNQNSNLYIGVDNAAGSNTGVAYNTYFLGFNAYPMTFYTNATERMRIDSSGNLSVGTTGTFLSSSYNFVSSQNSGFFRTTASANNNTALIASRNGNAGNVVEFWYDNSISPGRISITSTTTTYATSSDYRLKENVAPMTGALATVSQLKPVTYTWKADGSEGQGFIAHELAEVVPQAVTGEKDAVDEEGNPVYQGIDTSFLVATLTAAIQELKAELDTVKTELATLKGTA